MNKQRVVVVGAGGIGCCVLPIVARYMAYDQSIDWQLVIVDGDSFENKNASRQRFLFTDNKAAEARRILREDFPVLNIVAVEAHIGDPDLAVNGIRVLRPEEVIQNGDIVIGCVDNLQTRSIISTFAQKLTTIKVIDGGNDTTSGNVMSYVRRDGVNLLPPFEHYQFDLRQPAQDAPYMPSCQQAVVNGEVQLLIVNNMVASNILCVLQVILQGELPRAKVGLDLEGYRQGAKPVPVKAIDFQLG